MTPERLMQALGFAGLIPFLAFAFGVWWVSDYLGALSLHGFLVYSLAILCFLAGSLWGSAATVAVAVRARLLVSNGIVIFAVLGYLTAQPVIAALLLMLGHIAQLWYERATATAEPWYIALRTQLTAIVVLLHLFYVAALVSHSGVH